MEDLVKILAPLLTISACLLGLYEKYGARFTFEIFLIMIIALLVIIKFSKNSETETKDKFLSSYQSVIIKSKFGYTRVGDIILKSGGKYKDKK